MNGFSKVAFYEIETDNTEILPTYKSTPLKLYSGEETNNIKLEITANETTQTRKADDMVEEKSAETGYTAQLTVYNVDKEGEINILGGELDGNNNLIMIVNGAKKKLGAFFETTEADKRVQVYLSKITFGTLVPSGQTDEKGDPISTTLTIKGSLVKHNGKQVRGFKVYEGQTGFVESGFPEEFYAPVAISGDN